LLYLRGCKLPAVPILKNGDHPADIKASSEKGWVLGEGNHER
jgi:hypothetical protein